jgi:4-hydroxy-2-oxoheptanedioate aldolase
MVNDRQTTEQVVLHGKFRPTGRRGFNSLTPGLRYATEWPDTFRIADESTYLFVQIETEEAVRNLDDICSVEGLAGILIGPGDLSADMGKSGRFDDPDLLATITDIIARAKAKGKYAGLFAVAERKRASLRGRTFSSSQRICPV